MPESDERVNRRSFFRAALGELLKPLERVAAPLEQVISEMSKLEDPGGEKGDGRRGQSAPRPPAPTITRAASTVARSSSTVARSSSMQHHPVLKWLRPPGALPEENFRNHCTGCGECVSACPVHCIKIEPGGRGDGLPFIDINYMPCVLCNGLHCMNSCPSGALVPVPREEIHMGMAHWNKSQCMRTRGEECTTCVDQCPVGHAAIELFDGGIRVNPTGCTGCGVCEHYCPTWPKSITITPTSAQPLP